MHIMYSVGSIQARRTTVNTGEVSDDGKAGSSGLRTFSKKYVGCVILPSQTMNLTRLLHCYLLSMDTSLLNVQIMKAVTINHMNHYFVLNTVLDW